MTKDALTYIGDGVEPFTLVMHKESVVEIEVEDESPTVILRHFSF